MSGEALRTLPTDTILWLGHPANGRKAVKWQQPEAGCGDDDLAQCFRLLHTGGLLATEDFSAGWSVQPTAVPEPGFALGSTVWPGVGKAVEEVGELLQVLGKLIATGGADRHYDGSDLRARATEEVADATAALLFLREANGLPAAALDLRAADKLATYRRWHAEQGGAASVPELPSAGRTSGVAGREHSHGPHVRHAHPHTAREGTAHTHPGGAVSRYAYPADGPQ